MFLLFTSRVTQQTHEYNQTIDYEHLDMIEIDLCFLEYDTYNSMILLQLYVSTLQ